MEFLDEEKLLKVLFEGLEELAGDKAKRTFQRLLQEMKGQDRMLSVERALIYIFDKAGHPILWQIGYRLAKGEALSKGLVSKDGYKLEDGRFIVEVSKCGIRNALAQLNIEPTKGMACSLCKGYMHGVGDIMGFGSLVEASHKEGVCQFSFGGK